MRCRRTPLQPESCCSGPSDEGPPGGDDLRKGEGSGEPRASCYFASGHNNRLSALGARGADGYTRGCLSASQEGSLCRQQRLTESLKAKTEIRLRAAESAPVGLGGRGYSSKKTQQPQQQRPPVGLRVAGMRIVVNIISKNGDAMQREVKEQRQSQAAPLRLRS